MRRNIWLPATAALLTLAAGCGSTVEGVSAGSGTGTAGSSVSGSGSGSSSGGSGSGGLTVSPGGTAPGTGNGGAAGTQGGSTINGGSTQGGSVGGSSTSSGTAPGSSGGTASAQGPGITASTIYVGVAWSSQAGAGDKALGGAGESPSYRTPDVVNSIIAYANAHGGFAGRKLQAVYYDENISDPRTTQNQAACQHFTTDNKVFVIFADAQPQFYACAAQHGALPLDVGGTGNSQTYSQYPQLIDPDDIRLDRLGAVTVTGLAHAHYFAGKLGLVTWDDPAYRYTIAHGYLPALSKYGITPRDTAYINVPQDVNAVADMSPSISAAINKFKAEGIDHVIIQDGPAGVFSGEGLTFEWMNQAKSQVYFPRYGANADNFIGSKILPSDEQNNAISVSAADEDPKYDAGWHQNQARQKCFQIEAQAGMPVSPSNDNDEGIAALYCDGIFALQKAFNAVPSLTVGNVVNVWQHFGKAFATAWTYGSNLFPGRRDGGDEVRNAEYSSGCQCLNFLGPPYFAG